MSTHVVGTLGWARATGGILGPGERARMVVDGVGLLLGSLPARFREWLGLRNPRAIAYDLARIPMPDSPDARRAEQLLEGAGSPVFRSHSYRTYVWGELLGLLGGLRPDHELLYVAALLHDLTLTDTYRDVVPEVACFAGKGATAAAGWAREWGWNERRCRALGDAISLHLNASVPTGLGVEAHLLNAAAALDVIGHRHWDVAPETRAAVLARYPRLGMKREGLPVFLSVSHPGTRAHLLNRRLMFPALVRYSQFAE